MIEIHRRYEFAASHRLLGFGKGHKCYRMHGHNWFFELTMSGDIDEKTGVLIDFGDVDVFVKEKILNVLDHNHLNDILDVMPTCENIAIYIFNEVKSDVEDLGAVLESVKVWETQRGHATYRGK